MKPWQKYVVPLSRLWRDSGIKCDLNDLFSGVNHEKLNVTLWNFINVIPVHHPCTDLERNTPNYLIRVNRVQGYTFLQSYPGFREVPPPPPRGGVYLSLFPPLHSLEKTLPSKVQNEVQPTKEQSNCANLKLTAQLTVTWWKDEYNGGDIADPLNEV